MNDRNFYMSPKDVTGTSHGTHYSLHIERTKTKNFRSTWVNGELTKTPNTTSKDYLPRPFGSVHPRITVTGSLKVKPLSSRKNT